MSFVLVAVVTFFAIFTQSVSGFGLGLVSMALLPAFLDIQTAVPLVTLIAICVEVILLLRYRHSFNLRAVGRLSVASLLGIPIGLLALEQVDGDLILRVLGILIALYAVYALLNFRLPTIHNQRWAYGFGFISGILTGLYNVGGPPLVVYGSCRNWSPDEFRGNLQGMFILTSVLVIAGHMLSHNYTPVVWQHFLAAVPAIAAGLLVGILAGRHIDPAAFRKIVFLILLLLGLRLVL